MACVAGASVMFGCLLLPSLLQVSAHFRQKAQTLVANSELPVCSWARRSAQLASIKESGPAKDLKGGLLAESVNLPPVSAHFVKSLAPVMMFAVPPFLDHASIHTGSRGRAASGLAV